MNDYRINYLTKNAKDKTYKLDIRADKFVFVDNDGVELEMKPILPRTIEIDQGDSVMIVTKNKMLVKNKIEKAKIIQERLELK